MALLTIATGAERSQTGLAMATVAPLLACGGGEPEAPPAGPANTNTNGAAPTPAAQAPPAAPIGAGGGGLLGNCSEGESPAMCGSNACAPVSEGLALTCVQGCCTEQGTCGTHNAVAYGPWLDKTGGEGHQCPGAEVLGSAVPGCCVEGTNTCGVVDLTGFLSTLAGGDSQGCVPRSAASLGGLPCDGAAIEDGLDAGAPGGTQAAPDAGG